MVRAPRSSAPDLPNGWLSAGAPGVETFGAHRMNSEKSKVMEQVTMTILSQARGTPLEGAQTSGEIQFS